MLYQANNLNESGWWRTIGRQLGKKNEGKDKKCLDTLFFQIHVREKKNDSIYSEILKNIEIQIWLLCHNK